MRKFKFYRVIVGGIYVAACLVLFIGYSMLLSGNYDKNTRAVGVWVILLISGVIAFYGLMLQVVVGQARDVHRLSNHFMDQKAAQINDDDVKKIKKLLK